MKTIAISGKGGTGKTTLAALIIRWLSRHEGRPILAVDADANVNLNDVLGVELRDTLGSIREEMRTLTKKPVGGMTKQQFLEYKIQSSLVETPDFDLIAMGRPEGPGCYCYANNLLRDILKTLSANYKYVVIDNQAGMEHLSRQTSQYIDYLLFVSDSSLRGIRAAGRISRLIRELDTRVREKYLVLNRVQDSIPQKVADTIKEEGLHLLAAIPDDATLVALDQEGKTIDAVSEDSLACLAVSLLLTRLLKFKETEKENP
jgi:CO dehydrogenase maturation factor